MGTIVKLMVSVVFTFIEFEFPVGHYVEKVIIPNQLVLEGGIRTTNRLHNILNYYKDIPQKKIALSGKKLK